MSDIPVHVSISPAVRSILEQTVSTRRHLHAHPELSMQEYQTAEYIERRLHDLGLQPQRVAETGVTALLDTGHKGRTLLVRADIDALPIIEENTVPYKSTNAGVMHACGHDCHTAIGLSTADMTGKTLEDLKGRVLFVFQPGEETVGATTMLATGFLKQYNPDNAVALHLWNTMPTGKVGVTTGPCMAAVDRLAITIKGSGGHAAQPHLCVDAVAVASAVVTALQQVVSRNVSPLEAAVVTVASIHGGSGFNIITGEVIMEGTIRTYKPEVQDRVHERIQSLVQNVTRGLGGEGFVEIERRSPPVVNDAAMADLVREVAAGVVGKENVLSGEQSMGGEDFAYFLNECPGCFFFVGSKNESKGFKYPHHHPKFDIDEAALAIGMEVMKGVIRKYLE